MSSAKKKPILVTCPQCSTIVLTKDSTRHQDFCGKPTDQSEISCTKNGFLRGFNVAIDKPEGFLPPDAVGWEKEHSILLHPQTMESLGLLTRQPVRIHFESTVFIGIVWPCKEISLLKISIFNQRIPRERMINMERIERKSVEILQNLSISLIIENSNFKPNNALRGFLEAYLSHSYLEYGIPIGFKYLGQNLKAVAEKSMENLMETMKIEECSRTSTVISVDGKCKLSISNFSTSDKSSSEHSNVEPPFSKIGGIFRTRQVIEDYILAPIQKNENPISILIYGIPGSGKTLLLKEISRILGGKSVFVGSLDELMEIEVSGANIVILDVNEIEKENSKAQKVLRELLEDETVCVILSVRSSDTLDIGFRVRFAVETEITVPTQNERMDILSKISPNFFDFSEDQLLEIARHTHGFTGGDLNSLLKSAKFARGATSFDKIEESRKRMKPTGIRQFILEVPNVSWKDIGGNEELKLEIQQAVIWPQKHPEAFERFGIDPPAGILLYGPPGCSKTLIARALANEAKMNFLAVKGPELFSKWVGDSEKAIRDLFSRARQVAPTIVFFDEIDAVGSSRGSEKSSGVSDRVLAQLLTELDGLEKSSRVILLAATNRPDQLDSALLRPGRLDRAIYVGLPCEETRKAILEMRTRKMKFENPSETIQNLVGKTAGYSGAELVAVCRTAAMFAMRENIEANLVEWKHFEQALTAVVSRTEAYLLEIYDDFKAGRTSNA